ncbi:hypothetical protein MLD38_007387 [Melastoma candidum]|uniref:Uncharacterized protein n=1 Tax=Melastoma candidum TaxID=119954 RepID=A0ACB9RRH8_9MYRT|nr:hypothetical protein MLD38_007387 [Melastoma candidum]
MKGSVASALVLVVLAVVVPFGVSTAPAILWSRHNDELTNGDSEKFVSYQVLSPRDLAKSVLSEGGWSDLLCPRNKKEQPTDVALVFIGRELQSLDISSGGHGDSALLELLKVSFETSNSSVAFPYVETTEEEIMEASLITGFKEACGLELEPTSVAFLGSCALKADNYHKLSDLNSLQDHLASRNGESNGGKADLILFCHDADTSSVPVLESEVLSELVLSVERVGRKPSVLYVSHPCRTVEYSYSEKLARFLAESTSSNASDNSTCQGVCQVKSTMLEGVFVGVVLLVILISGLGCMMGIQTPSRFEAPQDS